jgi:hypothetical protein
MRISLESIVLFSVGEQHERVMDVSDLVGTIKLLLETTILCCSCKKKSFCDIILSSQRYEYILEFLFEDQMSLELL